MKILVVNTKKNISLKINRYSILLYLLIIMPFIDSISGALYDQIPVGQIYRLIFFIYILLMLSKISKRKFIQVTIPLMIFFIIQGIVGHTYIAKCFQDIIKLFTPIILIVLFEVLIKEKKICAEQIFKLLDCWCICYPLLILVPGIMGIGNNAYADAMSFKGFFYATNEISFILSGLIMYSFWRLKKDANIKSLIILAINCLSIIMMGTKTGYATILVFTVVFILSLRKIKNQKSKIKIFLILGIAIIILGINFQNLISMTKSITERWYYQKQLSYSTTDFLFSMRLRRFSNTWNAFSDGFYFLTGWGFGKELSGIPNMEMDFLDLFFKTGIVGVIYISLFYIRRVLGKIKVNKYGFLVLVWSMLLAFGAGHVLFYGQSGMALAIIYTYVLIISKNNVYK